MDPATREANHVKLFKYVSKFTSSYWGVSFVSELQQLMAKQKEEDAGTTTNKRVGSGGTPGKKEMTDTGGLMQNQDDGTELPKDA